MSNKSVDVNQVSGTGSSKRLYRVIKLVNMLEPPLGEVLKSEEVQKLIDNGVWVTVVGPSLKQITVEEKRNRAPARP